MREYLEPGYCQEMVESHLYRVIDFRQCQCKEKWRIGIKNDDGTVRYKNLCTRHKNDYLKSFIKNRIISVEKIENNDNRRDQEKL